MTTLKQPPTPPPLNNAKITTMQAKTSEKGKRPRGTPTEDFSPTATALNTPKYPKDHSTDPLLIRHKLERIILIFRKQKRKLLGALPRAISESYYHHINILWTEAYEKVGTDWTNKPGKRVRFQTEEPIVESCQTPKEPNHREQDLDLSIGKGQSGEHTGIAGWFAGVIPASINIADIEEALQQHPLFQRHKIRHIEIRTQLIHIRSGRLSNKEPRVQALHITTSYQQVHILRQLLKRIYSITAKEYPLDKKMWFVPNTADIRFPVSGTSIQMANILRAKQNRFSMDMINIPATSIKQEVLRTATLHVDRLHSQQKHLKQDMICELPTLTSNDAHKVLTNPPSWQSAHCQDRTVSVLVKHEHTEFQLPMGPSADPFHSRYWEERAQQAWFFNFQKYTHCVASISRYVACIMDKIWLTSWDLWEYLTGNPHGALTPLLPHYAYQFHFGAMTLESQTAIAFR